MAKRLMAGGLLMALVNTSVLATPWGMHADGQVKVIDGRPAICIPADVKKGVAVESVWLLRDHPSGSADAMVWDLEVLPGAIQRRLEPGECLHYGVDWPGYQHKSGPLTRLEPGRYRFRLNSEATKRTDVISYWGRFCVARDDGSRPDDC